MAKKTKKYITVFIAVLACAAMLTETAFAASSAGTSSEASSSVTSSSSSPSSGGDSSSVPSSGGASSTPASSNDGNGGVTPPPSNQGTQVNVTMDFNGGTGGATQIAVPRGTPVGDLATPVKKGFKFAGWTSGGNPVSSSLKLTVDIVLTAQWAPETVSSASSQQAVSSSPPVSVDTHQSEVDAAASQADATISEPDATSSEDWSALLSSGSSSSSGSALGALQSSQNSSGAAQSGSGFSTLLAIGIGLIVLALAGIGLFIYLQFFRGRNVPPQGGSGPAPRVSDSTIEFTDISSFSGKQEHGHTANPQAEFDRKPAHSRTEPETRPVRSDRDDTRVMPQRFTEAPEKTPDRTAPPPIAQARPVTDAKSEFDWEKFFDSEK
jgi:uncharacterized repeat protein (TIGR02543 family)